MSRSWRSAGGCAGCGAPVARGQRYCVECGERIGPRSRQLLALLARLHERSRGAQDGPQPHTSGASVEAAPRTRRDAAFALPAAAAARLAALRLPSPRVSALLVIAFAGFGVLIGSAASSRVDDTLAASAQRPLRIVLPPPSAVAASGGEASSAAGEPPAAEAEATPEVGAAAEPATPGTGEQYAGAGAEGHAEAGRRRRRRRRR